MSNQITVTESLANGLKNRFFTEIVNEAELAEKDFICKNDRLKRRNGFAKLSGNVRTAFKNHAILVYEGGSTKKPYVAFDLLTVIKDREYNSWNEKCLTGNSMIFNFEPSYFHDAYSSYNIGEHAISRVYLRTKPKVVDGVIDWRYITPELVNIPLWSNFWGIILYSAESDNFSEKCFPVIPAVSGLFMCEFSNATRRLEIRTFVDDAHLTYEQLTTKRMLLKIGADLISSPLCFLCVLSRCKIDNPGLLIDLLAQRIKCHPDYSILKNVFFRRVEDDSERLVRKAELDRSIKSFTTSVNEDIDKVLIHFGVKRFQLEIKKIALKGPIVSEELQ
jgi:hypothetical protein